MSFGVIGFLLGLYKTKKPNLVFPNTRLMMSYYFNGMMQNGLKYAHNASSAALMYTLTGYVVTKIFEEDMASFHNTSKNALIGFLTGALYKSTRGYKAALVGGTVGTGIIVLTNIITDELRERDLISFEMRFDS